MKALLKELAIEVVKAIGRTLGEEAVKATVARLKDRPVKDPIP